MNDMQPGQTIMPHDPEEPQLPPTGAPEPERPVTQPDPLPAPAPAPGSEPVAPHEQNFYRAEAPAPAAATADWKTTVGIKDAELPVSQSGLDEISWTAAEFIEHKKGGSWYAALAGVTVVLVALAYLMTRDRVSAGVVLLVMVGFGLYASRRPGVQEYSLNAAGIRIGSRMYQFQDYQTFSVSDDGPIISIIFMPLKRFMPPLSVYVTPEIENQVINYLSTFLPFNPHHIDATENLMRRIRF